MKWFRYGFAVVNSDTVDCEVAVTSVTSRIVDQNVVNNKSNGDRDRSQPAPISLSPMAKWIAIPHRGSVRAGAMGSIPEPGRCGGAGC